MEQHYYLEIAAALLADWIKHVEEPEPNRLDVVIAAERLPVAVERLHKNRWGYLVAITGLDDGAAANQLTALYHFAHGATVLTLRVTLPRDNPVVPSICGIIPSASFYERELHEMLGVTITDTPTNAYLFLPDEWPVGVYPLRKEFGSVISNQ